jgi:uncharacterized phage protein (TIGR01671 family)
MREIKFRAWVYCKWLDFRPKEERNADNSNFWIEKWVMGVVKTIHFAKNKARVMDGSISSSKCHDYLIGDTCIIMQYTGLKDKNGKEIYEGDIVNWGKKINGDVYYSSGRYWVRDFYQAYQDEVSDAFGEGLATLEVVGNIYENPELLK